VDSKGVKAAINKAEKAGIKVITVDIPAADAEVTSFVGTDNFAGGEKAAELMAKSIGGKGNVADDRLPDRAVGSGPRRRLQEGSSEKHKDVKIVAQQTGITRAEALAAAQNMLQANPDIVRASSASATTQRLPAAVGGQVGQARRTRSRSSASTAWKRRATRSTRTR
jgi:ribose transport system substrate-binding protein